jgi:uncharacterized protein (DUF3084 family)
MKTINLRSSISGMLLSAMGLALFISGCGGEEGKPVSTPNVPAAVREKAGEVKEEVKEKVTEAKAKVEEVKQEVKAKVEDAKKVVGEKVDAAKEAVKEVAKDAVKKN